MQLTIYLTKAARIQTVSTDTTNISYVQQRYRKKCKFI